MDFEISKDPLHIGTAAEHLVCADIWARGFPATMAPQACPYDIIAQMPAGLVKIQVKATVKPMPAPNAPNYSRYLWHVRRAGRNLGYVASRRLYHPDDFDMLALVALDVRKIAYVEPEFSAMTMGIKVGGDVSKDRKYGGKPMRSFERHSFENAFSKWVKHGE